MKKATNWTKHLVRICKQKRPQPWSWAQAHEERVRKHWNWKLLDAKWEKTKAQCGACRLLCTNGKRLVRWQTKSAYGLSRYVRENYEDPSDYVMGWVDTEGGHDEESSMR
jgi:aldehyde:ferredoxin oxidoreductase